MATRDERIASLAATLKSSGVAKSDAQARMMAEEMIGVEENVQKRFDEEHTRAQEFLKTAKNLGDARISPTRIEPVKTKIEPIKTEPKIEPRIERKIVNEEYTDVNYGSKPLSQVMQEHDTHNPAIEAIKQEMSQRKIVALEDMDQPTLPKQNIQKPAEENLSIQKNAQETAQESVEQPKLDSAKLVEMMEEDGKMEEHTREIKEKPKNVKPKEEYAENTIDLSAMFNVHK